MGGGEGKGGEKKKLPAGDYAFIGIVAVHHAIIPPCFVISSAMTRLCPPPLSLSLSLSFSLSHSLPEAKPLTLQFNERGFNYGKVESIRFGHWPNGAQRGLIIYR